MRLKFTYLRLSKLLASACLIEIFKDFSVAAKLISQCFI
jgi:hypothetical protein